MASSSSSSSWLENTHEEERAVGIELYANTAAGFEGVLKERFSDFVVREIDRTSGKAVVLTDINATVDEAIDARERAKFERARDAAKEREAERACETEAASTATEEDVDDGDDGIDEEAMKQFESLCGEEDAKKLREFLETPGVTAKSQKLLGANAPTPTPLVLTPSTDKGKRTAVHQFFKQHFHLPTDNVVVSQESEKEALKNLQKPPSSVRVHAAEKSSGKKRARGGDIIDHRASGNFWPEGVPEYLKFAFCKENKESYEMLNVIARSLNIQVKDMGIAGTKDKRGVTTQHVTVHKIRAKRLAKMKFYGAKVGNFEYVDTPLGFGDHAGNSFEVTLRQVEPEQVENVEDAVRSLRNSGTINYFGLQRFGNGGIEHGTHKIGIKLLSGDWQGALDLLLMPRENERTDVSAARAKWAETKDPKATLKILPRWCTAEKCALERMMKVRTTDLVSALLAVPRQIRLMYIHAYQAYIFNRVVSARIRKFGVNTVVEGDLILEEGDLAGDEENQDDTGRVSMPSVRVVTAEEAAAGVIDPALLVLPLPGNSVVYPTNMGDIYREIAAEDGIDLNTQVHAVREFSMVGFTGDYRRVYLKPTNVAHRVVSYADPKANLVLTDLDRINGVNKLEYQDGPLRAVTIEFHLPPSSYATMVLRELMKSTTATSAHKRKTLDANAATAT